jgi:hypothetical protein
VSQNAIPAEAVGGGPPADLRCGFCKNPVTGVYYRTRNRFACGPCVEKARGMLARNVFTPESFIPAGVAGLVVGLGCAVAWAVIVHVTNFEIGIIASFIGYAVGRAVFAASGKRRGLALQWLAGALSVVGIVGGKLMLVGWAVVDQYNQRNIAPTPAKVTTALIYLLTVHPTLVFSVFDLLWTGIAVYAAVRLCKAPRITIAGPYQMPTKSPGDLQFETMEPAVPPDPGQP